MQSRCHMAQALLWFLTVSPIVFTGCGGSEKSTRQNGSPAQEFVFVAPTFSNAILTYGLDLNTGKLSQLSSIRTPAQVTNMVVDPTARFLYAGNGGASNNGTPGDNNLYGYAIDSQTGTLTAIPGSPFPANYEFSSELQTDSTGTFLYTNDLNAGMLSYQIDQQTGALGLAKAPFLAFTNATQFVPAKNGIMVVTSGIGKSVVSSFRIDPNTGALTHLADAPLTNPNGGHSLAVDPGGTFVYVNSMAFKLDPTTGAFSELPGAQAAPSFFDPTAPLAFAIEQSTTTKQAIVSFSFDSSSGQLTSIPGSLAGGFVNGSIDASGKFIVLAGTLEVLAVDRNTGALTILSSDSQPSIALAVYPPVQIECGPLSCTF